MKTDRELLELAAKAAEYDMQWPIMKQGAAPVGMFTDSMTSTVPMFWNPLTDDGDALRLAVKLNLWEAIRLAHRLVGLPECPDIYAATRLAITRAAAAIGEGMAQSTGSTELPEDNYYKSQAEAEEAGRAAAAIGEALP
jgi:hypothetical protein